jgi:hypothetical protein
VLVLLSLLLSLHRVRALLREAVKMIVVTAVLAVARGGMMVPAISKAVAETVMLLMLYQR